MKNRDADRLARYAVNMADKKPAVLMATKVLGQRTPNLGRALDTLLSLKARKGADNRQWAYNPIELLSYRIGGGTVVFP